MNDLKTNIAVSIQETLKELFVKNCLLDFPKARKINTLKVVKILEISDEENPYSGNEFFIQAGAILEIISPTLKLINFFLYKVWATKMKLRFNVTANKFEVMDIGFIDLVKLN